jgi:hypothetical protein
MRSFITCTLHQILLRRSSIEDQIGGRTRTTHGKYEKFIKNFLSKILKGRDHVEDLDVDGRIILECILGI